MGLYKHGTPTAIPTFDCDREFARRAVAVEKFNTAHRT
jgi:hypothetical protein